MDLLTGYELIDVLIYNLTYMRKDSNATFFDIITSSTDYSNILNTVINILSINARQRNQENIPAKTFEKYYR